MVDTWTKFHIGNLFVSLNNRCWNDGKRGLFKTNVCDHNSNMTTRARVGLPAGWDASFHPKLRVE